MSVLGTLKKLDDFDELDAKAIEKVREEIGMTTVGFADALGWPKRKYQRVLEGAKEDGAVSRDVALAVYGLTRFLGSEAKSESLEFRDVEEPPRFFADLAGTEDTWTVKVAPYLMQGLVQRAKSGQTTTYGAEAERLEAAGRTGRMWPRTVYGHPLGLICEACIHIGSIKKTSVPLLTAIVVAQSGEPGSGFDGMVQRHYKHRFGADYREMWRDYKANRSQTIIQIQSEVFDFPYWDQVLEEAGI